MVLTQIARAAHKLSEAVYSESGARNRDDVAYVEALRDQYNALQETRVGLKKWYGPRGPKSKRLVDGDYTINPCT